ncbi:MAG: hypothetical protein ACF8OB_06645 [Phycisphaeraceae bacterium JB051]
MHRLAVVSLFVAMVLSGCHPFVLLPESEVMVEVKGRYIHEFEVQRFKPQGSLDDWWLTWNDAFCEQWDAATDGYCVPVWVHVKGKKIGPGLKGHQGRYLYELQVTEVIEMRLPEGTTFEDKTRLIIVDKQP